MRDPGRIFDVLGDPTRRRVIAELSTLGSASSTELARTLPISRQAVSKHLDALSDVGLVTSYRDGRAVLYRLEAAPFNDAVRWMTDVGAAWDERLSKLRGQINRRR